MQLADRTWKPCAEGPVSSWTALYQRPGVCIKRLANNDRALPGPSFAISGLKQAELQKKGEEERGYGT